MAIPASLKSELKKRGSSVAKFADRHAFPYPNVYMTVQKYWASNVLPRSAEGQAIIAKLREEIGATWIQVDWIDWVDATNGAKK